MLCHRRSSACLSVSYLCSADLIWCALCTWWRPLSLSLSLCRRPRSQNNNKSHKCVLNNNDNNNKDDASGLMLRRVCQWRSDTGCVFPHWAEGKSSSRNEEKLPENVSLRTDLRWHPALTQGGAKRFGNICKGVCCLLPPSPKNNRHRLLCEWILFYFFSPWAARSCSFVLSGGRSLQTRSGRSGSRSLAMSHNWGGEARNCFNKTETPSWRDLTDTHTHDRHAQEMMQHHFTLSFSECCNPD